MRVGCARAEAAEWVMQHASLEADFRGAYFSGSTIALPDDAELSPASDIDVVIVTAAAKPPLKLGKFIYRGTLVEVTYLSWNELVSAEEVLTSYHLAGSFRVNTIISDPTGHLRKLQAEVSRQFAELSWVRRRCENVRHKIETGLRAIDTSAPLHDLVTSWLFPTGVTTHLILVAALRNPTVRLRYLAARDVLMEYGHADFYLELLQLLGCSHLTPQRVEHHLDELARTFDAAAAAAKTPFFFSTDITAAARPIAIDGSRDLIRTGHHREAVFWIVATFARCHKILAADAPPDLQRALAPAFDAVIADLGITSTSDFIRRAEVALQFLPRLWETAETILLANPDIVAK
ncbi:hypothetical protein SD70_04205 [Gordoniibacillus kamchatkensis]|uniref:Polymerase nucleotidyl transferase domain-containing protein n=1 Tax=Gordoniibacillus kamchatkensis TaxID=1590651 RepID=A0ABR5ALT2_9BACL|nr:hypothetical protein [Paenibacillus sp. VKM B-2647]KIL41828.1 hypothetical protein SD70_04205 [Paenibacillus sp. VKM B-2647]